MKKNVGSKNFYIYKRIIRYLALCKKKLFAVFLCLIASIVIGFFQPLLIRSITDQGMAQQNLKVIIMYALLLFSLSVVGQLLDVLETRIFANIHNTVKKTMFAEAFRKLLHLKIEYFADRNSAEIIENMQTDVARTSLVTDRTFVKTVGHIFKGISGLVGLLVISWKLTLVVLLVLPFKYTLVKHFAKKQERSIEKQIESSRDFARWFNDSINGIREIKIWRIAQKKMSMFSTKQDKILFASKEQSMLDAWNSLAGRLLDSLVSCILYILSGVFIVSGTLTIGGVFAFISYSAYVIGPISALLNMRMLVSTMLPSAKRLFHFMDMEEEEDNKIELEMTKPIEIRFCNVSFSYGDNHIIKNLNMTVGPGEKVAIIGHNGSGKTTVLNLLLRFIKPKGGFITIGGKDIWSVGLENYRKLFSVVSQDPYLFFDTVKNNINLNNCSNDELFDIACQKSGASKFVYTLSDREHSMIGTDGAKLSGGEKQKLAVARAIINDAPFIILDEATSSYDIESDGFLYDFIRDELKGKTVIIITHKPHHLSGMDKVYEMKDGVLHDVSSK